MTAPRGGRLAECAPEIILSKLLGQTNGAIEQVSLRHGVVILSGNIYEEGSQIFLQTYVHFARRAASEDVRFTLKNQQFTARLPAQSFAFPPRKLSVQDLNVIERQFASAILVRSVPDINAPGTPIPVADLSREPFSYSVQEVRGDWMRIQPFGPGPGGWLQSGALSDNEFLTQKMPEMHFVDGLTGYLRYRVAKDNNETVNAASLIAKVEKAIGTYEMMNAGKASGLSGAIGQEILGLMYWLKPQPSSADLEMAHVRFNKAAGLLPYNADARNMDDLGRIRVGANSPQSLFERKIADSFLAAIAMDPENEILLSNLQSFYKVLQATPSNVTGLDQLTSEEVSNRLRETQSVRPQIAPRGRPQ